MSNWTEDNDYRGKNSKLSLVRYYYTTGQEFFQCVSTCQPTPNWSSFTYTKWIFPSAHDQQVT